jgi:2-polyprenyl-6-hydroxyphenyl methylase/3-demethylubiquinone-9 3-methyltransferase
MMQSNNENVFESEIDNFSKLAKDWWNPKGELKTLHTINPLRLNYITSCTSINNKKILDIGCGGGLLCEALAKKSAHVTGIDMSEDLIDVAKQHADTSNIDIEYYVDSIENFAEKTDQRYDIITCMEMLEHIPDPTSVIKSAKQLLNPHGHLFLSTINRTVKSYVQMVLSAEYLLRLIPRNTHQYSQFIKPHEMATWLRKTNLSLEDISGIRYIPLIDYPSLTDDVSVNYIVHAINIKM